MLKDGINLNAPTDYSAQAADIERRRKLSEALQMQSMETLKSPGTAGGLPIKISPYAGLAQMLQAYTGGVGQKKATEESRALSQQYNKDLMDTITQAQGAATPELRNALLMRHPATQPMGITRMSKEMDTQALINALGGGGGAPAPTPMQAPQSGVFQGTGDGGVSQEQNTFGGTAPVVPPSGVFGGTGSEGVDLPRNQLTPEPAPAPTVPRAAVPATVGGSPLRAWLTADPSGKSLLEQRAKEELQRTKPVPPKEHVIEGKVYQTQPDGTLKPLGGPGKPTDYNKPFLPDGKPNPAYQAYAQKTARAGATNVTVDNKAEGAYAGKVAGEAGEADRGQFKAAQASVENLHKIDTVLNHLRTSDAKTGLGAELLLNVERAKTFLGAGSKTVSDTELLDTMLGSEVFPMIQTLGIGARGMDTPAEREFLRKVMAGTITLNKDTLVRMTEMRKDIAQRTLDNFNKRVDTGELDRFFKYSGMPKQKLQGPTPKRRATDKVVPAPAGVDQKVWDVMTPEERALWK